MFLCLRVHQRKDRSTENVRRPLAVFSLRIFPAAIPARQWPQWPLKAPFCSMRGFFSHHETDRWTDRRQTGRHKHYICLERGADLHMAQLMAPPLTISCFNKNSDWFYLFGTGSPDSPGQRALKRMCVCVFVRFVLNVKTVIMLTTAKDEPQHNTIFITIPTAEGVEGRVN